MPVRVWSPARLGTSLLSGVHTCAGPGASVVASRAWLPSCHNKWAEERAESNSDLLILHLVTQVSG